VKADGEGLLVFNPTSATRSGMVGENFVADLPAYGYRFIKTADLHKPQGVEVSRDGRTIENADFRVVFDASRGVVVSIHDKKRKQETLAPNGGTGNRLEIHWEKPNGMSAWTIGEIEKVEPLLGPVDVTVTDNGIRWERTFQSTTIHQSITMAATGPPEFAMETQWKELGGGDKLCPFLKVAFDILAGPINKFACQIPFGAIDRPIDGVEVPALKWADLSAPNGFGAAIINDSKHGYSAKDSTLRLSLIRSSYWPDARPNDRPQSARWIFHPHLGDWRAANIVQEAEAFNHPLLTTMLGPNKNGTLPPTGSLLSMGADNVIVTGVKRAEDDNDLVIRFYEAYGKKTHVEPKLAFDVSKVATVNFIEDKLTDEKGLAVDLRPYEIRTLKISTKAAGGSANDARQPAANGR
jgi:alpha-mannosidase